MRFANKLDLKFEQGGHRVFWYFFDYRLLDNIFMEDMLSIWVVYIPTRNDQSNIVPRRQSVKKFR